MPMADSLIERAKEVATTGTVDDAFKVVAGAVVVLQSCKEQATRGTTHAKGQAPCTEAQGETQGGWHMVLSQ